MITFITKKTHKVVEIENEIQIKNTLTPQELDLIRSLPIAGFDLETNDLDPYKGSILLMIIGDKDNQFVIDAQSIDCEQFLLDIINNGIDPYNEQSIKNFRRYNNLIIGANIKFDYKFVKVKYNITFTKMYDVMIAEQRLNQGKDEFSFKLNKRIPLSAALDKIVQRRLGFVPNGMDKSIRNEFIGVNPSTFQFENKHMVYAANDISHLFAIREIQKAEIAKYNQGFLIYNIEFPLIRVLADCELRGLNIHEDKWRANIAKNKDLKFEAECELDKELRRLRDTILPVKERVYLSNGKYDRNRLKETVTQESNLFGEAFDDIEVNKVAKVKKKTKAKSPYINYSSTDEVIKIFGRLKQPAPTKDGDYQIPTFKTKYSKKGVPTEVVDKSLYSYTTKADVIDVYKIENADVSIKEFVTKLIDYRTYVTRISTFGEEFLRKFKNNVTKRFHTVYRQCDAITGRLQSGAKDEGNFNSQNIVAEENYRTPFHDKDNDIMTYDLKGAEAVIMIDKARDDKFYQMAIVNDDAHSPLGTAVWRAIGNYRLRDMENAYPGVSLGLQDARPNIVKAYERAKVLANIVISKKENKDIRTIFKNTTFASIYGCGTKKYSKMLAISVEEAKIGLDVMRKSLPKTFRMVTDNAKFALEHGYIILNHRTNSRMWFTEVLDANKSGSSKEAFKYIVESAGKNGPIQGTQADLLKEAMVEIHKEAERQNLYEIDNFALLLQVHDELVYSCKDQNRIVEFVKDDKTVEMVTIKEFNKKHIVQVANRYLSFINMDAEENKGKLKTWTK